MMSFAFCADTNAALPHAHFSRLIRVVRAICVVALAFVASVLLSPTASATVTCPSLALEDPFNVGIYSNTIRADALTKTCPGPRSGERLNVSASYKPMSIIPLSIGFSAYTNGTQTSGSETCSGLGCIFAPGSGHFVGLDPGFGSATLTYRYTDSSGGTVTARISVPAGTTTTLPSFTIQGGLYDANQPTVLGVSPSSGAASGGTDVTITGANFTGVSAINFGGVPATSFTVVSATEISATTPPNNAGSVDIDLSGSSGSSTATNAFTYTGIDQQDLFVTSDPATLAVNQTANLSTTGGDGTGAVTYAVTAGDSFCSVSGSTLTGTGGGTCTITATKAADTTYLARTATTTVTVTPGAQAPLSISATPSGVAVNSSVSLSSSGGSGSGNVTYAVTAGAANCSVSGSTLTGTAIGSCTVTGTKAGDSDFEVTTATVDVTVVSYSQTIDFTAPGDQELQSGSTTLPLSASASSGLPVTFSSATPAVCTVSGTTVHLVTIGTCTISANQAGDANYAPAVEVTHSFSVNGISTTVALQSDHTLVDEGQSVTLTATVTPAAATGTITFSVSGTEICSNIALTSASATCTFTPTKLKNAVRASFHPTGSFASATSSAVTVSVRDPVAEAVKNTARFLGHRTTLIFNNLFGSSRQIGRLNQARMQRNGAPSGYGHATNSYQLTGTTQSALAPHTTTANVANLARMSLGASPRSLSPSPIGLRMQTFGANDRSEIGLPVSIQGSSENGNRFSFSTSLSEIQTHQARSRARKVRNGLGYSPLGTNYEAFAKPQSSFSPLDIWIEGRYASFNDDAGNADIDGHFGSLSFGADYVLNSKLLVGLFAQFDTMEQSSKTDGAKVTGKGWLVGPYLTTRLTDNVFLQARGGWGGSFNDITPTGTYSDDFSTDRWLVSSALVGNWTHGAWGFEPSISVGYMNEQSESYVDSNNNVVPAVSSRLGQMRAGPKVSYRYHYTSDVIVEPRMEVQAIWDFVSGTTASGYGDVGDTAQSEDLRLRSEVGVRTQTTDGISFDISGSYDGIGSDDFRSISGRAAARIPLN